jgi:hypothetical protein
LKGYLFGSALGGGSCSNGMWTGSRTWSFFLTVFKGFVLCG